MAEEKKQARTIDDRRMQLAEHLRQDWVVNAEEGSTVNDVLEPSYWAHVARRFQIYDHIEVRLETGEWLLQLLVVGCGRNWAKVHVMHKHDLEPVEESMPSAAKHKVVWKGPQHKFVVLRNSDSEMIQDGFADKLLAQEWLRNHEKATA